MIKSRLALVLLCGMLVSLVPQQVLAQADSNEATVEEATPGASLFDLLTATDSAEASAAASVRRVEPRAGDLTETRGEVTGKLEEYVFENIQGPVTPQSFLRYSIRTAILAGVPANTIVLLLMFPIITALIAASRHLIGLRGFGIFTPAIVAVGFLATGLTTGFLLIFVIIGMATGARVVIRRLKMPYMPRTSLLLWFVSLTVLLLLLVSPFLNLNDLAQLSIFPILLMVLLAETFMEVQNKRSKSEAIEMTLESLLLAIISYFVMNLETVQRFVLVNPEIVMVSVAVFNLFLGKFGGLRLLEYRRFRSLLDR